MRGSEREREREIEYTRKLARRCEWSGGNEERERERERERRARAEEDTLFFLHIDMYHHLYESRCLLRLNKEKKSAMLGSKLDFYVYSTVLVGGR